VHVYRNVYVHKFACSKLGTCELLSSLSYVNDINEHTGMQHCDNEGMKWKPTLEWFHKLQLFSSVFKHKYIVNDTTDY